MSINCGQTSTMTTTTIITTNNPRTKMTMTSPMTNRRGNGGDGGSGSRSNRSSGNSPSFILFRSFVLLCVGSVLYSIHFQQLTSRNLRFLVVDDDGSNNVKQQQEDDEDYDRPTTSSILPLHQQEEEQYPHQQKQQQQILSIATGDVSLTVNPQGIHEIQFFNDTTTAIGARTNSTIGGMNGCLINLDDTIRLAEWIPYHYTLLPLKSLILAFDPNTTAKSINRTLQLVDLWKDKIDVTVWPDFVLPSHKVKINHKQPKRSVPYVRQRQMYFAEQCLIRHKQRQLQELQQQQQQQQQQQPNETTTVNSTSSSWTLLTDNDEYLTYNYIHEEEEDPTQYFPKKDIFKKRAMEERTKYYEPIRKKLLPDWISSGYNSSSSNNNNNSNTNDSSTAIPSTTTIVEFLHHHRSAFNKCIRLPSIRYGPGNETTPIASNVTDSLGVPSSSQELYYPPVVDDLTVLSTIQGIYHTKRLGKGSKVMIDLSRVDMEDLHRGNGKTIHNPNQRICGYNGATTSGTDYIGSVFRLQHYLGSVESFLERKSDYRSRSLDKYYDLAKEVSKSSMADHDIVPWINAFVAKVGLSKAKELLRPLEEFSKQERQQDDQEQVIE